ncbi:aldo/keto reductase [Sphingomonas sp.]|uniref:aldo/keto reductase n=1 Tax=Sphingomonas sp. TaxID=28214 RepID=UPI0035C876CC
MSVPQTLSLRGGATMPAIGLGVYQSTGDEAVRAVESAIAQGYRLIDTAAAYGNEAEVGAGIRASGIACDDIFVTTKLKPDDYGEESALRAFERSEKALGVGVIDLYLLHWPMPKRFDDTVASWQVMERLLAEGRVRAIGVCNFNPDHLEMLAERCEQAPVLNQVELHPFLVQENVRAANAARGIVTQAWSPIGGVNRYWDSGEDPLTHPTIVTLAEAHGKSPAQIVLRWHLERGVSAIPKSVRPERIAENIALFDFALSPDEVAAIDTLDQGRRGGPDPDAR